MSEEAVRVGSKLESSVLWHRASFCTVDSDLLELEW